MQNRLVNMHLQPPMTRVETWFVHYLNILANLDRKWLNEMLRLISWVSRISYKAQRIQENTSLRCIHCEHHWPPKMEFGVVSSAGRYFDNIEIRRYENNIEYPIMISWLFRYIVETRYDQNIVDIWQINHDLLTKNAALHFFKPTLNFTSRCPNICLSYRQAQEEKLSLGHANATHIFPLPVPWTVSPLAHVFHDQTETEGP